MAIGYKLALRLIGPDELSWLSGFPYLDWRLAAYIVIPRVIIYGFTIAGCVVFSRAYESQTKPYRQAYIQEHDLGKQLTGKATILRVTFWHILALLLVLTNITTVLMLIAVSWNASQVRDDWRRELQFRSAQVGRLLASRDFHLGKKRLYELENVKYDETVKPNSPVVSKEHLRFGPPP